MAAPSMILKKNSPVGSSAYIYAPRARAQPGGIKGKGGRRAMCIPCRARLSIYYRTTGNVVALH